MQVFIANWFLPQAMIPSCHSVRGVIRIRPCDDTRAALVGPRARQPTPLARGSNRVPNYQSPLAGRKTVIQPSANLRKVAEMRNEPAVRDYTVPWPSAATTQRPSRNATSRSIIPDLKANFAVFIVLQI
jgi:hypothetical protein